MPLLFAAIVPAVIAQHRRPVWLQAVCTCVMLAAGGVFLRAAILLKPYREQTPALSKKVWRASALAIVLIFTGGFGALELLAQTWRAWFFFGFVVILCFWRLFYKRRGGVEPGVRANGYPCGVRISYDSNHALAFDARRR